MKYLITPLPLISVRREPVETSELTTQFLFGELLEVLEVTEKWLFVRNLTDEYSGWVVRNMVKEITTETFISLSSSEISKINSPYTIIYNPLTDGKMLIPGGSILYNLKDDEFMIGDERWCLIEPYTPFSLPVKPFLPAVLAIQFLNAPYLWGGKTILGMDCAALVQLVFSMAGIDLPRDAQVQVNYGKTVDFITEASAGDLAFFEDEENEIVHVGILTDSSRIIHASGCVKVENIDSQGIISSVNGEYTHRLRVIKRIIAE